MGAGDNLKGAATHPGLEAQLEVLGSPDVEARVVGAQPLKELRGIRYLGIMSGFASHLCQWRRVRQPWWGCEPVPKCGFVSFARAQARSAS